MFSVRPPFILRVFDRKYLSCSIPTSGKVIYLTFDDGPIPEITSGVLSILEERNIQATFFCVGDNVKKHPDLFAQISGAGHAIGNHSFHHLNGWKTPPAEYVEDVMRCNEYFKTNLFRPPYGKFTPSQYFFLRKHFRIILWSVLSGDYHLRITKEQCLQNVLNFTKSGSIVVFHDSMKAKDNLFYALPRFLDEFLEKGFRFDSIGTVDKKNSLL
jgi:peptidoglycan/xylan/chitin deacetylase (PgdA/CDA1 family)